MKINPMGLDGRTFLVTGASSGIGREIAILLAQLGATTLLSGRDHTRLTETARLADSDPELCLPFDLSQTGEIPAWLKDLAGRVGPLDGFVHSAGLQMSRPLRLFRHQDFELTMQVNVEAALALAKGFRQKQVKGKGGSIVLLSSVMGLVGESGMSLYSASKGALTAMTRSLAVELASEGIRVNCIAPGIVRTPMSDRILEALTSEQMEALEGMHPLGFGTPQDIAAAVAFLLADTSRWMTGSIVTVDGGYTAH